MTSRTLSVEKAKRFYDSFGAAQNTQAFYEDDAVSALLERAALNDAKLVFEFGSGTGRVAERLFRERMGPLSRYRGVDVSDTMVALARKRLAPWKERAEIILTDGSTVLPAGDGEADRFLSTFVFDLLSEDAIGSVLTEAHRILTPRGLLCLANATPGRGAFGAMVSSALLCVNRVSPSVLGGCRPIAVAPFLSAATWRVLHREVICSWGISSEVLIAEKREARH